MEFLQDIGPSQLLILALGLGVLCVVGVVLIFGLQFILGIFGTAFSFVNLFFDILSGGPIAWCGCLLLLGTCGVCGALTLYLINLAPTCAENFVGFCYFIPGFLR